MTTGNPQFGPLDSDAIELEKMSYRDMFIDAINKKISPQSSINEIANAFLAGNPIYMYLDTDLNLEISDKSEFNPNPDTGLSIILPPNAKGRIKINPEKNLLTMTKKLNYEKYPEYQRDLLIRKLDYSIVSYITSLTKSNS